MLTNKKSNTLADQIGEILSAAPTTFDPEDDFQEETRAKLTEDFEHENDDLDENILLSDFRRKNTELLEDTDVKYTGKKASRKDVFSNDNDTDEDLNSEEEDTQSISSSVDIEESNDGSTKEEQQDENEADSIAGDIFEDDGDGQEAHFAHLDRSQISNELNKGQCVRNQLKLWENLLEVRIQLQKCLNASNKLPQKDAYEEIKNQSNGQFDKKVKETVENLTKASNKMMDLQKFLIKKYPETRNLTKTGHASDSKQGVESDDDKISSDTDNEQDQATIQQNLSTKRRKLNDYEKEISSLHATYCPYRDSVIQKWNDKTQIRATKSGNKGISYSILSQIKYNLSDKARLIKKTKLKRVQYNIIGKSTQNDIKNDTENTSDILTEQECKVDEEYDEEIYDDNDFYHQLLRELIEVKSADLTDPVQLSRQWIQLQNLRSKMKRKIDTRATKGRKIRYTVHNKLINYMAPIEENSWSDEAKTELFSSLFGKGIRIN